MSSRCERERDLASADADISELLAIAGKRPMPDVSLMSRARAAARSELKRVVRRRRLTRLSLWTGALVAVAAGAYWTRSSPASAPFVVRAEMAALKAIIGTLTVTAPDGTRMLATGPGLRVRDGDRIETSAGAKAVFSLTGGTIVKVDAESALAAGPGWLRLERGAVYVDTGSVDREPLDVRTSAGVVRHVGTQFEVRDERRSVLVRVREGIVSVERSPGRVLARAGEAVRMQRDGSPERHPISSHGPEWAWVEEALVPFTLEGATLEAFLDWASREQGWRWEYRRSSRGHFPARTILHGSIEGLTVTEALDAVLPTCGLRYERDGGVLHITGAAPVPR